MRKTDLQFSLPSFDELKSSAFNPPSPSGQKQAAREMNVIRAAVPAVRRDLRRYCFRYKEGEKAAAAEASR